MSDRGKPPQRPFPNAVGLREKRKIRAQRHRPQGMWFGLGMFGIVGWSVAVPAVVLVFLGIWIDLKWPGAYSWTLMLLVIGLILGCLNAWFWVNRERQAINKERGDDVR